MKTRLVFDYEGLKAFIEFLQIIKETKHINDLEMTVNFSNVYPESIYKSVFSKIETRDDNNGAWIDEYVIEIEEKKVED